MAQRIDTQVKWLLAVFGLAVGMVVATSLPEVSATAADPVATPQAAEKAAPDQPAAQRRVLIVSIDGLRPDLALLADTPNIHAQIKAGTYTMWAQTLPIGKTLPSHTSMLTGVSMEKHGVYWNDDWLPRRFNKDTGRSRWPTILERAKEKGYTTALCAGKTKFEVLAPAEAVDFVSVPDPPKTVIGPGGIRMGVLVKVDAKGLSEYDHKFSDDWVAQNAERIILAHKPQVMFVHFGRVDSVGHAKGWGSPQQLEAIEAADKALGRVFDAMRKAGVFDSTVVILSADHGGFGRVHDGKDPRGLHIPWVIRGPNIKKGYDLTQQGNLVVNTMDTFATACHLLGIPTRLEDSIEGKVVWSALESTDFFGEDPTEKIPGKDAK